MSDDEGPRAWLVFFRSKEGTYAVEDQFTLSEDGTGILEVQHTFDKGLNDMTKDRGVWITFYKDDTELVAGYATARITAPGSYSARVRHATGVEVATGKVIILGVIGPPVPT